MQVKGGPAVTLSPGQTWYEGPDDVHVVSRNASNSSPAKLHVVFLVKDKGAAILTPVKSEEAAMTRCRDRQRPSRADE